VIQRCLGCRVHWNTFADEKLLKNQLVVGFSHTLWYNLECLNTKQTFLKNHWKITVKRRWEIFHIQLNPLSSLLVYLVTRHKVARRNIKSEILVSFTLLNIWYMWNEVTSFLVEWKVWSHFLTFSKPKKAGKSPLEYTFKNENV
jgi:hypothetical protein